MLYDQYKPNIQYKQTHTRVSCVAVGVEVADVEVSDVVYVVACSYCLCSCVYKMHIRILTVDSDDGCNDCVVDVDMLDVVVSVLLSAQ